MATTPIDQIVGWSFLAPLNDGYTQDQYAGSPAGVPASAINQGDGLIFASIPETIRLRRSAVFSESKAPMYPDGVHFFKYTEPMSIPFEFELSTLDYEMCSSLASQSAPQSALTICLAYAARLHAMVMPVTDQTTTFKAVPVATDDKGKKAAAKVEGDNAKLLGANAGPINDGVQNDIKAATKMGAYSSPPPCVLQMIEANGFGIRCLGYVKDVDVELHGPYINVGKLHNVPTSAKFSFTFMHVPGYQLTPKGSDGAGSQNINMQLSVVANRAVVLAKLYNTLGIAATSSTTPPGANPLNIKLNINTDPVDNSRIGGFPGADGNVVAPMRGPDGSVLPGIPSADSFKLSRTVDVTPNAP